MYGITVARHYGTADRTGCTAAEQSGFSGRFVKGHFLQFPLQACTLWSNQVEVNLFFFF
jgi:hypothetical protein